MPTLIKWETEAAVEIFPGDVDGDADTKDLANGEGCLSAAIDNTDGNQYIHFLLRFTPDAAPTAGGYFSVHLIKSVDGGTVYEDGSVSSRVVTASQRAPDVIFPVSTANAAQAIASGLVLAPPCHFKILLVNASGQGVGNTDGQNTLHYQFVNDEIQ